MEIDQDGRERRRTVLFKGKISKAQVISHINSPTLNYGEGFFETILFQNNKLHLFEKHIERIERTARFMNLKLDFSQVSLPLIEQYLNSNNLMNHCCRIKIIYAPIEKLNQWDFLIYAIPYTRPIKEFSLSIHNEVYDSQLNRYKSLNYSYNLYWKNHYTKLEKSDEVMFCNKWGFILEGSYTNIIYRKGKSLYYVDQSLPYLSGIMQDQILGELANDKSMKLVSLKQGIDPKKLLKADEIILCNSLLLAQNVGKIVHKGKTYSINKIPHDQLLSQQLIDTFLKEISSSLSKEQ